MSDGRAGTQPSTDSKFAALSELLSHDNKLAALSELVTVVSLLHFRVSVTAQELHQKGEFSGGRRAILSNLKFDGPATVPHLARIRPVSRQFIQKLANEMAAEGLVEFIKNPEHKRSKLLRITAMGERLLANMLEREAKVGIWLARDLDESELQTAARIVRNLRDKLVHSAEWLAEVNHNQEYGSS